GSVDRNPTRTIIPRPNMVAPRAGAWIEAAEWQPHRSVAPRAGAWIETWTGSSQAIRSTRRSPRGSVDRNKSLGMLRDWDWGVAPRAGAWIETCCSRPRRHRPESLPARERG